MGGGSLTVKDNTRIEFTGSDGYGVYVGKRVMANLTDVTITGSGDGKGIEVAKGGAVWLKETHLRDVVKGMTIEEAVVVMEKGSVEFKGDYGIDLTRGYAFLGGVEIKGKETEQEGIRVNEGMLDLYKTNVRDVYKGMTVWKGGIRMFGGSVEFTGDYGIDLTRGYAFLGEVNIEGKETGQEGIKVSEGMLNLYKTNVRDVYKGMTVKEGSVVRMFEGEITFKGEHAISLTKGYVDLRKVRMTYTSDGPNANFIKIEGGKVLAEEVTITGNGKGQGVKVANGGAVWLKNTTFTNVRSGMTVEREGIMRMEGGSITFNGGHGIDVSGGQAVLTGFSITGQGDKGTGVGVSNLGEVMMREVNISGVEMGAYVTGYGLLVMDKGSITFKGKHGINLISGYALLNGVEITGPGSGTGIELGYGQVLMKDTTFTNVDKAITVTQGDVKMEGGEITFTGEHGILLGQGGVALMGVTMRYKGNSTTADFIKITGEDTTNAVEAVDPKTKNTFTPKSAVVVAASLKIDGSGHGQALKVTNGGRVVLVNPTYTDVYTGMTITKGAVQMLGGEITFKGDHGILLKRGHALLTNVTMEYKGHEKNTTFLKVEAENVLNTADIIGTGIKIDGKGYGQGVYVTKGGRVKLKNAVFSDVVKGVSVVNGEFWMKGGEIAFKGDYGVSLSTGKVLLKRVIMKYKGDNRVAKGANTTSPNFVKVDGRGANLAAIKVVLTGNEAGLGVGIHGVHITRGGHVVLNHSHLTEIQNAITVEEGSIWMGNGLVKFKGDYGILLKRGHALLTNVQINYEGNKNADFIKVEGGKVLNTANIRVMGIKIEGNGKGQGVYVANGGHVVMIRSELDKVNTGITAKNAEITMDSTSMSFKGSHGVSLSVGKAILNKVSMTHTGDNDTDFLKAQGKGANLAANKVMIKGSKNKGQGLHVTNGAKITLLQSELTGVAKGIHIDSGMVNVRRSTITVEGDESCGISLWGSQKSTETHPKRSRRSASRNLTVAHHMPKMSEVGVVNLTLTTLKVPNNTVIHGRTAKSFITLKDSNISGASLLEAKSGSTIMLATNNSSLTGGSHVDDESDALFYLTNKSRWLLTKNKKNQNLRESSSLISGIMLKDSAIIFEKPTSDDYQTLHIGKGYHSIYLAEGDAQLHLNIQIGQDGSLNDHKTDRVLIHGNVSGTTKIHMNTSSNGEVAVNSRTNRNNNNQSVSIIQVSGSAQKNSFQLNYGYVTLNNSPYQHHLVAYGPGSELKADPQKRLVKGDGDFWDFRLESKNIPFDPRRPNIVPIKPAIVPQAPTYLLLPNALFYAGLMDINNQTELLGTMVTSFDPFFNGKPAFFIRGYGGSHNYASDLSASEYGYGGKFGYRAADAAVLLSTLESEQNSAFVGVIGTYGKLSLQPQDVEKSKKSNFDHWSVTAYASLQHNMGYYVNGLLSYGLSRGDVETLARGKTARITSKPLRAALTGGKAFLTGYEGLVFEPQMQLIYQYLMFNSARDIDGFSINMGTPNQLTTRLGGRLAQEFALMEEDSSVSFYGKLHLMGSFGGKQFVQFKDTFQLGAFGSSMEAGVGVQAQLSSQIALHGDVVYQQKLTKAGFSGSTFSGGLRYRF
ncbi:autotransporter outer membrane beta-barrel domain-containing protein [Bartonella schoenbuchensis]|uniref:autotransporter outer membrane beta-barrel domain-containing protein n=1 Tax=Bartonella schoenbuchensis TaxID=165694 RepID=UPI0031450DB1